MKAVLGSCSLSLNYPISLERANRMPVEKIDNDQHIRKGLSLECWMCETMSQWVAMAVGKRLRLWTCSVFLSA